MSSLSGSSSGLSSVFCFGLSLTESLGQSSGDLGGGEASSSW